MSGLPQVWNSLSIDAGGRRVGMLLRRLTENGLHIGLDLATGRRLCLLEIEPDRTVVVHDLPAWRGLQPTVGDLEAGRKAIVLTLLSNDAKEIFDAMIDDISEALLGTSAARPFEVLLDRMHAWREFFERFGDRHLSREAQQGLYGELHFLLHQAMDVMRPPDAVRSWRGHDRKHQDFLLPSGNVEVKTTAQKEHKSVLITSEKQLDDTGLRALFLYCLEINADAPEGPSLPDIVDQIRARLTDSRGALLTFDRYLNQAGYIDEHAEYYADSRFAVAGAHMYCVRPGFPRITTLPTGVGGISYTVVLSACSAFEEDASHAMTRLAKDSAK
jgi:hypothetical protein